MNSEQKKNIQSLIIAMIEKKVEFGCAVSYQRYEYIKFFLRDASFFLSLANESHVFDSELERVSSTVRDLYEGETEVFRKDVFIELAELIANQPKGVYSCLDVRKTGASLFISMKDDFLVNNDDLIENELIRYNDTAEASLQKIKVLYRMCRDRLRKEVADDNE